MIAALVRKELREILPFVVLAALADGYFYIRAAGLRLGMLTDLLPTAESSWSIPFIGGQLWPPLIVAGVLGAVVGLWQTMWESSRGTFLFLLHRPIRREAIVGSKLLVGAAVCALAAVLPVAVYSIWAATPGTHASPFFWSMTTMDWLLAVGMTLVYFGAFLSGLRPARVYGSRFLPLAGSVLALLFLSLLESTFDVFRLLYVPILLVVIGLFAAAILFVANSRDYS